MRSLSSVLRMFLAAALLLSPFLFSQTEIARSDYFPAEQEFAELQTVVSNNSFDKNSDSFDFSDAWLFREVGFDRYLKRAYRTSFNDILEIETITLRDARAAYSALSLLRTTNISPGTPGDFYAKSTGDLRFVQSNVYVRIHCNAHDDLSRKIAVSIGNRIGHHEREPLLIGRAPKAGLDPTSLRFFLGPESLARFAKPVAGRPLVFQDEVQIAQAPYHLEGGNGLLTLIEFPTTQMADAHFDGIVESIRSGLSNVPVYYRRTGPILGILEGELSPEAAEKTLGAVRYVYSVQWIYDKNQSSAKTLFGIPVRILGTVVRSLFLTALFCGSSLVLGAFFGLFRIYLRKIAPGNFFDRPARTEIIRLKMEGR